MKPIKIILSLAVFSSLLATSCKKDPDEPINNTPTPTTGSITFEFDNMVGSEELVLNDSFYVNQNNDTFNVTLLKYYITNIKLYNSSGNSYAVPESYYLIDESNSSSKTFTINDIPFDTYTTLEFMIGVDSTRNVSGAQTGALDVGNNMFWSWSSGYIMVRFEGTSPQSTATANAVLYHIGGFSGTNNVLKTITPNLNGNTIQVSSSNTPKVHLMTDLLEMFKSPTTMDFGTTNSIHMPGAMAKTVADNYADMITVDHIH